MTTPLIDLAEGVGFEPTSHLHGCRFSRPVRSTAPPSLLRARIVHEVRALTVVVGTDRAWSNVLSVGRHARLAVEMAD